MNDVDEGANDNLKVGGSIKALILAAGKEFGALEVFGCHALVPLVNRPLIWYPLNLLKQHNFVSVDIVCARSAVLQIQEYVDREFPSLTSVIHPVDGDGLNASDRGSLELFHYLDIKFDISTEVLLLPCDLIATSPSLLTKALNEHWRRNAALTVMLSRPDSTVNCGSNGQPIPIPGDTKSTIVHDTVVMDKESNRLLYALGHGSINKDLDIPRHITTQYPSMIGYTDVRNSHFFIFRGKLFNFLIKQRKWRSLADEAIPSMINNQMDFKGYQDPIETDILEDAFSPPVRKNSIKRRHTSGASNKSQTDVCSEYCNVMALEGLSKLRYTFESKACGQPGDASLCCGFMVLPNELCWRANSVQSYMQASVKLLDINEKSSRRHSSAKVHQKCSVGGETYVGAETVVGERCKVKSSVFGSNCDIKERVKITGSIIMDNVTIKEGSVINNCIIGTGVSVGQQVELKECIVTSTKCVPNEAKGCNQILPDEESGDIF